MVSCTVCPIAKRYRNLLMEALLVEAYMGLPLPLFMSGREEVFSGTSPTFLYSVLHEYSARATSGQRL